MPKQRRNTWDDDDADDRDWERDDYDQDDDIYDGEESSDADDDALLPCPHCGAAIYEQSEKCPKCGEYVDPDAQQRKPLWIVVTLLLLIATLLFYALF